MTEQEPIIFTDRDEWRAWLEVNHAQAEEIWLGYYKKHTGKKSVKYDEAVEEALCFGWIDSLIKRVDENIYKQKYTPRKKGSVWSIVNKKRVKQMIDTGKMTSAGLKKVEEAKRNGNWASAYGTAKEEEMPDDLLKALKKNKKAFQNFFAFTKSIRNRYISYINAAKREETRQKRILIILENAENNIKPGF